MTKTEINKIFNATSKLDQISVDLNDKGRAFAEVGNRDMAAKCYGMSRDITASQNTIVTTIERAHPTLNNKFRG